jgi:septal ring factor EnvC (AmiA/AmiB activator)
LLVAKRAQLDALIDSQTTRQSSMAARSQALQAHVDELARQAQDLRSLFAKLEEDEARRRQAAQTAPKATRGQAADTAAEASNPAAATYDPTAAASARPFSKARGTLPFPAVGRIVTRYGDPNAHGQTSKGITIATRAGATVVTPYDGVVAFAGPFRGYGQLIIVEHSEGYHTLMAGVGRVDVTVGQHVLAGEPVAAMADDGAPTLYVELRRDSQPIDPLPWLAERASASR